MRRAPAAPVLAGVAILSGAAASFPTAMAIGLAYVAGMVTPLALVALLWDKRRERATRLLSDRTVGLRFGHRRRQLRLATVISAVLMIAMGVLAVVLAFTGPGMPSGGWQTQVSAWLQHISSVALNALSFIPGWAVAAVVLVGFALLIRRALRTRSTPAASAPHPAEGNEPVPVAGTDTVQESRREQDQR